MDQNKPILLDLFCGAGGATRGYQEAGFYVVGVDIEPQPRYCGDEFVQDDVIAFLEHYRRWPGPRRRFPAEAVHASPPCQANTSLRARYPHRDYPELIPRTRELLISTRLPYVIENVPGSALKDPVVLCGSTFGLRVRRHRLFECSFAVAQPSCDHKSQGPVVGVYGHTGAGADRGKARRRGEKNGVAEWRAAMGIDWMTRDELAQAIPPAYTRHLGFDLRSHVEAERWRMAT